MIFNLIFFALFGTVAFFQYTQGFFSATIAAVLAILASVAAVAYHEMVASYMMRFPEYADAVALIGIYIVAYIVPKILFDQFVPGNVRFPLLVDKIGAGAMGIIAGLFSTGLVALAAQTLPFGASIGYFSRQDLGDTRNVVAVIGGRSTDTFVADEVQGDKLGDQARGLWLNQDALVVGMASQLSSPGGSLANDHPFSAVHPNYLTEVFAERLGVPVGAKHVAVGSVVHVQDAFSLSKLPASIDAETKAIRGTDMKPPDPTLDSSTALVLLPVQFSGTSDIADTDKITRISPASIRLKAGDNDYYPVGTLVGGALLLKNRVDDPLLVDTKSGSAIVNFLFVVDKADALVQDPKTKDIRFKDGSFLQVKRYALQDLSGMGLSTNAPPRESIEVPDQGDATIGGIIRKTDVTKLVTDTLPSVLKKIDAQPQRRNGRDATPGSGQKPYNELDPTQIPIHGMGL
jgi:hypothetical protein